MRNFSNFFKSKKKLSFEPTLVQNQYINQNLANFSPKSTKKLPIFLNSYFFFKILGASGAKLCSFDTKKTRFFCS